MKYDDGSWHSGGDFPDDLPPEAGATHIGMFVGWAILAGLSGDLLIVEFPGDVQKLRDRSVTPGAFFLASCDGKFTDEDLNEEGNAFAASYYEPQKGYLADYEATFGKNLPTLYHVADTWENFDRIAALLDNRLMAWRQSA
ncbi:MAG: hypothetical protein ACLPX9_03725 [Rhodomicrobium sp.]